VRLKSRRKKNNLDWTWAALNLQPSDLHSNAYRSLPGRLPMHAVESNTHTNFWGIGRSWYIYTILRFKFKRVSAETIYLA